MFSDIADIGPNGADLMVNAGRQTMKYLPLGLAKTNVCGDNDIGPNALCLGPAELAKNHESADGDVSDDTNVGVGPMRHVGLGTFNYGDVGAVTSEDVAGVGASSPADDADFPSPLTAGCDPEHEATRSDAWVATMPMKVELPWPAYLNELGGEGTDNDIFKVCYREIWAVLPDADLVRAYIDTSPDPAFVNRRQRHIIMDCLIERVLRIDECRRSKCRFDMEVDNLFAAYPEFNVGLKRSRIYQSAFKVKKRMGYTDMFKSGASRRKCPSRKEGTSRKMPLTINVVAPP